MPEHKFYMRVKEPAIFRKKLLEESKEVISMLKDHHMLLTMQKEKDRKTEELKKHFEEMNGLLSQLDDYLPEDSMNKLLEIMPAEEIEKAAKEEVKKGRKRRKKANGDQTTEPEEQDTVETSEPDDAGASEVDKLEKMLNSIEKKLESIQ